MQRPSEYSPWPALTDTQINSIGYDAPPHWEQKPVAPKGQRPKSRRARKGKGKKKK